MPQRSGGTRLHSSREAIQEQEKRAQIWLTHIETNSTNVAWPELVRHSLRQIRSMMSFLALTAQQLQQVHIRCRAFGHLEHYPDGNQPYPRPAALHSAAGSCLASKPMKQG